MPDWRERALKDLHHNESQMSAVLMAALGRRPGSRPRFASKAYVTSDGYVMCGFEAADGRDHHGAFVDSASDLLARFGRMAKALNFSAEERGELLTALNNWGVAGQWQS